MTRDELRAAMPIIAATIDVLRKHFPEARVTYASENGLERGKRGDEGVIPVLREKKK